MGVGRVQCGSLNLLRQRFIRAAMEQFRDRSFSRSCRVVNEMSTHKNKAELHQVLQCWLDDGSSTGGLDVGSWPRRVGGRNPLCYF